jgi:hypothetical protein
MSKAGSSITPLDPPPLPPAVVDELSLVDQLKQKSLASSPSVGDVLPSFVVALATLERYFFIRGIQKSVHKVADTMEVIVRCSARAGTSSGCPGIVRAHVISGTAPPMYLITEMEHCKCEPVPIPIGRSNFVVHIGDSYEDRGQF